METQTTKPTKKELIALKPPPTPVPLEGDPARALPPATYHSQHGILQEAPQVSLRNQKVLDEDQYIQALSFIIKRDFFPSLDQFESQNKSLALQRRQKSLSLIKSPGAQSTTHSSSTLTHDLNRSHSNPSLSSIGWEAGGPTPKIPHASTPGMTPLGVVNSFSDTPRSNFTPSQHLDSGGSSSAPRPKSYDQSLSLDQFCSRYTSEDNSSFSEILNNANRLKRIKYSWAFDSSSKHNNRLLESTLKREHLIGMISKMAEGGHHVGLVEGVPGKPGERKIMENVITKEERLAIEASDEKLMITQAGETKQGIKQAYPDSQKKTSTIHQSVTAIDLATDRHLQSVKNPHSWPHITRNALMFGPDANSSAHQVPNPPSFPAKPPVLPGDPKSINYSSTRMVNDDALGLKIQASRSSRHSQSTLSPTRSQIAAAMNPGKSSSTPNVNGFSFVPELPTPNPDKMQSTSELDQLMTWGEIVSTPLRIDENGGEDGGEEVEEELVERGRFMISKTPRREQLAIGMARKASKSLRQKYGYSSGLGRPSPSKLRRSLLGDHSPHRAAAHPVHCSPHPRTPKRDEVLSPAARMLLKKTCALAPATPSKLAHSTLASPQPTPAPRSAIFSPNPHPLKRQRH